MRFRSDPAAARDTCGAACYGAAILTPSTDIPWQATCAVSSVPCSRSPTRPALVDFARVLDARGVELVSTGGTRQELVKAGLPVRDVADLTGFPEMMDGRLKTLHPLVHGGLLAIRENPTHEAAMLAHNIAPIDLLVVNLYPFEATVRRGARPRIASRTSISAAPP